MDSSITILNQNRTEFNFSKVKISSKYNIILHCVYDLDNQFESELAFLTNGTLTERDFVILWHPVEMGAWDPIWMQKLDSIVNTAKFKLVYLTGCSHKLNIKEYINYSFDVKFFPIFDIRSKDINFSIQHPININRNKKYMFINAKDTPHRRYILGSLIKNNLLNDGIVSYKCTEGFNPRNLDLNENLGYTQQQLKTADDLFLATEPYIPLLLKGIVNNYIRHLYQEPYVNIVGETHFSNRLYTFNTSFVTEKTFNAIANNQIFIVVGHTNSLDLLKSLGYKTFDSIVDESYDAIQDNGVRLETVAKEIIRFVSRPIEQIKEDYIKVIDIIKHNRDLLLSQDLTKRLQDFINENYA